jgi:Zn-dependent peptidase ImmA (M78 family)/transcriptional regulator with XRE-family HTH domain
MAEKLTGVNPKILKWARERARYSLESVAEKFKKIEKWETGEDFPTYAQLEQLASVYKRPIALFFFPEPPIETDEQQEFRTLPAFEIENLETDTIFALREAKAMQLSLREINDSINPSVKKIFREISLDVNDNLTSVTQQVREYLNVTLSEQISWPDNDVALKNWRNHIEATGIFVFKRSFKQKEISGFCLVDAEFPIIYLNNSTVKARQIFTIFHELAHILLHINGITKADDNYIDSLQGENQKIEIFCNKFAAEFLLPADDFTRIARQEDIDDRFIEKISTQYKVSREVVLRKLLEGGWLSPSEYKNKIANWLKDYEKRTTNTEKKAGGNYYATQATYLGENYLRLVFNKYYQGKYDIERVTDYLNLKKVEKTERLEEYLLKRDVL